MKHKPVMHQKQHQKKQQCAEDSGFWVCTHEKQHNTDHKYNVQFEKHSSAIRRYIVGLFYLPAAGLIV